MKTIAILIVLVFTIGVKAQLNFSCQVSGSSITCSITQVAQYYEFTTWSFGDGTYNYGSPYTNTQIVHTYSVAGNHKVCIIGYPMPMAPNDTACKYINILNTGIRNNNGEGQVHLFPNPVKDKLQIELPHSNAVFHLSILSVLGKTVYDLDQLNDQSPVIDLSFLSGGVYLVDLRNDVKQQIFKIVKE